MEHQFASPEPVNTRSRDIVIAIGVFLAAAVVIGGVTMMQGSGHTKAPATPAPPALRSAVPVKPVAMVGTMEAHSRTSVSILTASGVRHFAIATGTTVTPFSEILAVAAQADVPPVAFSFVMHSGVPTLVTLESRVQALEKLPHVDGYVRSATAHKVVLIERGGTLQTFTIAKADLPTLDWKHLVTDHIPDHVLTTVFYRGSQIKMFRG